MLRRCMLSLIAVFVAVGVWSSPPAYAAGIVVETLVDNTNADDGKCSLREAIINANNNAPTHPNCAGGTGDDIITFAGEGVGVIELSSPLPAIANAGKLTIDGGGNVTISGKNTLQILYVNYGAVLEVSNLTLANGRAGQGGAIYNGYGGTVTVSNSTFSGNSGSAIYNGGTLAVSDSTFSGNSGNQGGAIYSSGPLTVDNSTFSGNSATDTGGAIYNNNGTLTVSDSTFDDNTAGDQGGGLYNNSNSNTLTVSNSTFNRNSAGNSGGGLFNSTGTATISNSTFNGNSVTNDSGQGGGLYNNSSPMTLRDSTFHGNSAPGSNGQGGGLFNNSGALTVSGSTFSGNRAPQYGGGLYNNSSRLDVSNSTFSGNNATNTTGGNGHGGGLYNNSGPVDIRNSTFHGNDATNGGGLYINNGTINLANTIIANSTSGTNCARNGGTINLDTNLIGPNLCGITPGADPKLGPLADNGGPTKTHALLDGSPALDTGNMAICAASPVNNVDQRGVTRPQGPICDIGAYEGVQAPTAVELVSFTAAAEGERITLRWETGAEIDNAGFHLHRAPSPDGPYTRITDSLIGALGTLHAGAVYTYTDTPGQGVFYYRLEDVDTHGVSTFHGPAQAGSGEAAFQAASRLYVPVLAAD